MKVLVDSGALQMVVNALRRDAEEGRLVRGEMADALLAQPTTDDAKYAVLLEASERIAGFKMTQFMVPYDMALECVNVAKDAIAAAKEQA